MKRTLLRGNEAVAEAAVQAGCRFYAAYPITPQNEIPEYMSWRMPQAGGVFVQAESELSAINMVYGASAAGARAMTTSSSPGVSLMQEALSYLAAAELPAVVVNVQRGGPGLGNISGSQADYFQATKGGGHGDYRLLVYAPFSVQELWELTMLSFDKADEYRNPVMLLADGVLGQMMEPVEPSPYRGSPPDKPWALTGSKGRKPNVIKSLFMGPGELEQRNRHLQQKYRLMQREARHACYHHEGARAMVVAFGIGARLALQAVQSLRAEGHRVGLFRPITLFPFPALALRELVAEGVGKFIVFELNAGQMVEDVRLALCSSPARVEFHGRPGGSVVSPEEVAEALEALL